MKTKSFKKYLQKRLPADKISALKQIAHQETMGLKKHTLCDDIKAGLDDIIAHKKGKLDLRTIEMRHQKRQL